MKTTNRSAKSGFSILLALRALASVCTGGSPASEALEASAFDVWRWRNHAGPVFHSQFGTEYSPAAIFGYRDLQDHLGEFRFDADFMDKGVGFVEWRLRKPERIRSFRLLARHDLPQPDRAIGEFRLYTREDPESSWQLRHRFKPSIPYGGGEGGAWLNHTVTNIDILAQEFRAEFTAATALGPRIVELDAFTTSTPPRECWDALQGTKTTRSSGIRPWSRGDDLFGQTRSLPDAGAMHFRDGGPDGFIVWLEFRTPEKRSPRSFTLLTASSRGEAVNRDSEDLSISGYDYEIKRWRPLLIEDRSHESFDSFYNLLTTHGALRPFLTDRWRIRMRQVTPLGSTLYDLEGYYDEYHGSSKGNENPEKQP